VAPPHMQIQVWLSGLYPCPSVMGTTAPWLRWAKGDQVGCQCNHSVWTSSAWLRIEIMKRQWTAFWCDQLLLA
jgi:hypothetical protein